MTSHDDPGLLERVAAGGASAVHEVVDLYGDLVWSLARRFTSTDVDAEEAVQDIFVTLWRKAHRYDRAAGAEVTFVSILARRLLIDRWRQAKRRPASDDLETAADSTGASAHETDRMAEEAARAFRELDADVQTAMRLSIEFGCPHPVIAEITGTPLGTVKTRIRRGLQRVREAVEHGSTKGATP